MSNRSTPDHSHDQNSDAPADSAASNSKAAVRKDRKCPFCSQTFTSSSLGRHLDSFIREKCPKPPDGLHDVQEIRKMRENITRRHTRVPAGAVVDNSSRRWSVTSIASPKSGQKTQVTAPLAPKPQALEQGRSQQGVEPHGGFPVPRSWMVTGVINDLPQQGYRSPLPRILPRPESHIQQIPQSFGSMEDVDDARAAELALREVLGAVRSAAAAISQPGLFDFDFYACSFPGLCIRLLQAPAALFSTTPIPSHNSWPLGLPIKAHHMALQERLREKIQAVQDKHNDNSSLGVAPGSRRQSHANIFYQPEFKAYFDHVDIAFQQWLSLPDPQKHSYWHLECLRAFAEEREQKQSLQAYAERLEQDIKVLRQQLEEFKTTKQMWQHGGAGDAPRPILLSLPKNLVQSLSGSGIDLNSWDYETLIAKHKPSVQKARRQSATGPNDIRTAHERALSTFGPSESLLLRPMMGSHGHGEGSADEGGRTGYAQSDGDSQDGDGEPDADVDMENGPMLHEGRSSRIFGRNGPG